MKTSLQDYEFNMLKKSQDEQFPYEIEYFGKKFIVLEGVYSPKYFPVTDLFAMQLPCWPGIEFLEIGTGVGMIALFVAFKGASKVVATDINPDAVKNAQQNVILHNLEHVVEVRQGDVYSPINKGEKFDLIFWNVPFESKNMELSTLEMSLYDFEYQATKKYLLDAPKYLKPGGRLLMAFSTTIGDFNAITQILKDTDMRLELFWRVDRPDSNKLEIFELRF